MLSGARLALFVAELTSGTRAGLMLSSPDKSFFAPVCAVMAARHFPLLSVPHEAVFCTEVMLHSLGRGLAFLEHLILPFWGPAITQGFYSSRQARCTPQAGLAGQWWCCLGMCWDWQPPPSSLQCREVRPVCPPLLPVCVTVK